MTTMHDHALEEFKFFQATSTKPLCVTLLHVFVRLLCSVGVTWFPRWPKLRF